MVYRASALRGLAITQLVFGSLMIVFGIASIIAVHHWSSYAGFGIWVGIWVRNRNYIVYKLKELDAWHRGMLCSSNGIKIQDIFRSLRVVWCISQKTEDGIQSGCLVCLQVNILVFII